MELPEIQVAEKFLFDKFPGGEDGASDGDRRKQQRRPKPRVSALVRHHGNHLLLRPFFIITERIGETRGKIWKWVNLLGRTVPPRRDCPTKFPKHGLFSGEDDYHIWCGGLLKGNPWTNAARSATKPTS